MAKLPESSSASASSTAAHAAVEDELHIPLLEETLEVGKRVVETGKGVRVHKTITEREQVVDLPLLHDEITVEHVPIDSIIADAAPPTVRYEGNTMIVPVFEEVLVIQKQLRLKEEIHITRHQRERHMPQTFLLKTETATVERFNETPTAGPISSREGE